MTEDLKEYDKLIKEKGISDVNKMLEESKILTKNIPNLKERHEKVVAARGNVIEASVKIETALNELITKTGGENLVIDSEKKELHLITGAKKENELGSLPSFKKRMNVFKEILKKKNDEFTFTEYIQSEEWKKKQIDFVKHFKKCELCGETEQLSAHHISYANFGHESVSDVKVLCWQCQLEQKQNPIKLPNSHEPPLFADLEKFVALRDIFAHVPISWFAKELEFDDNPQYKHFFKLDSKWKNVRVAFEEFMGIQKNILAVIPEYVKQVELERKMMSSILLGTELKNVSEDDKRDNSTN
ncbi:hypothetical protein JW826_02265 [Candidatus Woesearchaeota archaeon]|nr:hypothetical protein [Candidatus Woesearchaeota archaeon]